MRANSAKLLLKLTPNIIASFVLREPDALLEIHLENLLKHLTQVLKNADHGIVVLPKTYRWPTGDLSQLVCEYHVLREVLLQHLEHDGELCLNTRLVLHAFIDQAIREAAIATTTENGIERRTSHERLSTSEARLRVVQAELNQAIEITGLGLFQIDLDHGVIEGSAKFWQHLAQPGLRQPWRAVFANIFRDDRRKLLLAIEGAMARAEPFHVEARVRSGRDPRTTWHWLEMRGELITALDGRANRLIGSTLDVTERIGANAKLLEAQDRLELAVQSARIGLWHLDLETGKATASSNIAELMGHPGEISSDALQLQNQYFHPDDRDRAMAHLQRTITEKRDYFDEFRVITQRGDTRWLQSIGRGRYTESGGTISGLVRDITEERGRDEILRAAKDAADRANMAKTQFLANMSHEIRTPLGAIIGFLDLLKTADIDPREMNRYVGVMERNADQLLRLIDDILDLSKVEAGKLTIERIAFSPTELFNDVASLMSFRARDKGIDLILKARGPLPDRIVSDPTRLRQIVTNVLGNALKFTEHGEVRLEVNIKANCLELWISDTGMGISAEQIENLFQTFHQADLATTRKFGGSGLGLVLTRRLCEAMGGEFRLISSEPGVGSQFYARIQVTTLKDSQLVKTRLFGRRAQPLKRDQDLELRLDRLRVLIVEDSPDNQDLISLLLRRAGADYKIVSDGLEALAAIESESPFNVILMDIQMPHMDGHQAAQELRRRGYQKPIVALSAHVLPEERRRAVDSGFTEFLVKPIQRPNFLATLKRCVPGGGQRPPTQPSA